MQAAQHKTLFLAAMLILGIQPLAAHTHVAQNSRLGLDTFKTSLHPEIELGSSLNALGIDASVRQTCVRSRSTGKERDSETGLDWFESRYYSSAQGRFTSPDEFKGGFLDAFSGQAAFQAGPLPYADISDPQTLNKYSYVRNNPLRYTDPDGHCFDPSSCGLEFAGAGSLLGGPIGGGIGAVVGVATGATIVYFGVKAVQAENTS